MIYNYKNKKIIIDDKLAKKFEIIQGYPINEKIIKTYLKIFYKINNDEKINKIIINLSEEELSKNFNSILKKDLCLYED